ncbi:MAG: EutN/CcmL family microcompartment protein [Bacteroidota bacterium]
MILAKVLGNVVSTIRDKGYDSKKVLIVQPVDPAGKAKGTSFLALDTVQAGAGDLVLVLEEGGSTRSVFNEPDNFTIKTVIVGIVDAVTMQ